MMTSSTRSRDRVGTVLLLALLACGGEAKYRADSAAAAAKAASPAAETRAAEAPSGIPGKAATGKTWDIAMIGDATGFRFEPNGLTVRSGDAVRWTVVSGPPHNVTFWQDSIPAGAVAQLGANMPLTTATLAGPLRMSPSDTYVVSFAGVPAGTYRYFCAPHLALGMKAMITVQ